MTPPDHTRDVGPSNSERGSQSFELAMALPVVLALATIVIAIGQVVIGYTGTQAMAAAGGRRAAIAHDNDVVDLLRDPLITGVVMDPPSGTRQPGDMVTVTVNRQVPVLWVPAPGLSMTATATFRTEEVP